MASKSRWLLFFAACPLASAHIDPLHATNLTVYHVGPGSLPRLPANMDVGDTEGDLSFYLAKFLHPVECRNQSTRSTKFDCNNPEVVSPNLVVTKVHMEVDDRFTEYSGCNLCTTGTNPVTLRPCVIGKYECVCFGKFTNQTCDRRRVGRKYVLEEHFYACNSSSSSYECWRANLFPKFPGIWYATTAGALCDNDTAAGDCGWRVLTMEAVQEKCLRRAVANVVQKAGRQCFSSCGRDVHNTSSSCWIHCFFTTVLGPNADKPNGTVAGIPAETLKHAWEDAFALPAKGGCQRVLPPEMIVV